MASRTATVKVKPSAAAGYWVVWYTNKRGEDATFNAYYTSPAAAEAGAEKCRAAIVAGKR